ncbi:MAG TPA: hypothetical protein VLH14_00295 [Patescibacteria group bacterium]|nr:hypothetical protein [Patescibacteria group bacterium]
MTSTRSTVLAPHWGANPELHEFAEARLKCPDRECLAGQFRGLPVRFSRTQMCEVIQFDQRVATMPEGLKDVPMIAIKMIERTTDLTSISQVPDGPYAEGDIVAHVDTHYEADEVVRVFRVSGGKNASIEEVNRWLDALIMGEKSRTSLQLPVLVTA